MKPLIFLGSVLFLFSCRTQKCTTKVRPYPDVYRRYMIILKDASRPGKLVMPIEFEEAIRFVESVSGIYSNMVINDHRRSYESKSDYRKDMRKWKHWFKQNNCSLTIHYVDSAYYLRKNEIVK